MRPAFFLSPAALLLALASGPASAASSPWQAVQGGRIRLVAADAPSADGTLRGAIEVDLRPGWKTYWRDPGDAGVPPQFDFSASRNASLVAVGYPTPQRFDENGASWVGYAAPVRFALTLKLAGPAAETHLAADVFMGICQAICIPLKAHLAVEFAGQATDPEDARMVAGTFAALPAAPRPGFRLASASLDGDTLTIKAEVPQADAETDLFVAAPEGYALGVPQRSGADGTDVVFHVPVLRRPEKAKDPLAFDYTLAQEGGAAVAGTLSAR